jgi:hypothetical protein
VLDAGARAALPSVAVAEDEDSEDDPATKLMTKPTRAEIAAGAPAAAPAELAAGLKRSSAARLPSAPPQGTIRVMGIAPPVGAPPGSSHRPPPARSQTLLSRVSPLLAAAKRSAEDELTIKQDELTIKQDPGTADAAGGAS